MSPKFVIHRSKLLVNAFVFAFYKSVELSEQVDTKLAVVETIVAVTFLETKQQILQTVEFSCDDTHLAKNRFLIRKKQPTFSCPISFCSLKSNSGDMASGRKKERVLNTKVAVPLWFLRVFQCSKITSHGGLAVQRLP